MLRLQEVLNNEHKTFIIAEIGQNHQGDVNLAKELVLAAKQAGANCVKFQKSNLEERFTETALARPYSSVNSFGSTYGEHRRHLELTDDDFSELQAYAASINILFTASAMDATSLYKMADMNVPFIKIGSGDANNFSLIRKAAKLHVPLVVSTGMQTLATVQRIYEMITAHHRDLVLMHCVSAYPTLAADANLGLIQVFKQKFPDVQVGYSGHEVGSIAHLAVAAGARVVERHFTLDRNMKGSDHACSLDPRRFAEMVKAIREVEVVMGSSEKQILMCERPCREKLGKSLVASKLLHAGTILTEEDVSVKVSHPPGLPAERIDEILGLQLMKSVHFEEIFEVVYFKKSNKCKCTSVPKLGNFHDAR